MSAGLSDPSVARVADRKAATATEVAMNCSVDAVAPDPECRLGARSDRTGDRRGGDSPSHSPSPSSLVGSLSVRRGYVEPAIKERFG